MTERLIGHASPACSSDSSCGLNSARCVRRLNSRPAAYVKSRITATIADIVSTSFG